MLWDNILNIIQWGYTIFHSENSKVNSSEIDLAFSKYNQILITWFKYSLHW